ncbi:MAG: zf-HC2 domain-containing protein [Acidobacteria bacterium]|nr:zf-HC2 domain-containing protein [Acidobacteriota bacterium]
MRNLIERLRRWLQWDGRKRPTVPPEFLGKVARQIEATYEVEYSCDDVHRLLDQFAEAVLRGEDATRLWPLVQRHLDMCPDCREEFEALMRVLRAPRARSAAT